MNRRLAGCAILLLLAAAGCGDGSSATLTGTVTYQGQPVASALMNFHNQGAGPLAYALTDDEGSYSVHTGSQNGLAPGKYKLAFEFPAGSNIPEKYLTIEHSGLEREIESGANTWDIALE